MSEQNNKVLVCINAKNCGVCIKSEAVLPQLEQKLRDENIDLEIFNIDKMSENIGQNGLPVYPNSLGKIWWYPFIFVVEKQIWEEIKSGSDHRDKLRIVNGKFEENKYLFNEQDNVSVNILNLDTLIRWIKAN